jgi:hypothetical protein
MTSFVVSVAGLELDADPLDPAAIESGRPVASSRVLSERTRWTVHETLRKIYQITEAR